MILSILVSFFTSLVTPVDTSIHATVEAQAIVSDAGVTPFWMRSLQYGSVPMENPGLVLRAWNGKAYNLKKKYDWKYEVEATGWTGKQNDFWLTQAYVSGRRGKWELWAGRKKEVYGLGDTAMTGGFYAWSGNAVPMPKIQLGTRDYLNFAKGWLGVHMTYSHGWFDNQGPTLNAYLHQKSLYGRIGKPESRFNLFGGINHQVSWGGKSKFDQNQVYPSSLRAYFYVITLLKDRTIIAIDEKSTWEDINNQYGNHLGSIDLALSIKTAIGKILIYKQNPYETARLINLVNADDGIRGISFETKNNQLINHLTYEYLQTSNQGLYMSPLGEFLNLKDTHYPETENYFNNAERGGWAYWGKGIGTPLIVINKERTNNGEVNAFRNNAIKSHYFGIKGQLAYGLTYILRSTYSKHGYIASKSNDPRTRFIESVDQFTSMLIIGKKIKRNLGAEMSLAADLGNEIPRTSAFSMRIRYILY
jgi:hypothetical protein